MNNSPRNLSDRLAWYTGRRKPNGDSPLELLVIQGTPFCNIDCSYCYLPDRGNNKRLSLEILPILFKRLSDADLIGTRLTVLWHAGEPLVLPCSFYAEAFTIVEESLPSSCKVTHSFQSNGTLLTDEYCDLITKYRVQLGLSVDGPAFIHDRHRRTRSGRGTHAQVMHAIQRLKRHGINFSVIAVLTALSLDYPDEIFEFFAAIEPIQLGFNIEEIEGAHRVSSVAGQTMESLYRGFMRRMYERCTSPGCTLQMREFDRIIDSVVRGDGTYCSLNNPLSIISVDSAGNLSTFSPELLSAQNDLHGDYVFGNVFETSFHEFVVSPKFQQIDEEIRRGIDICRSSCAYFGMCGGGSPSNKLHENGTFVCGETMFCRLMRKTLIDVVLADVERRVGIESESLEC